MPIVILSLGSNLGDRKKRLIEAASLLELKNKKYSAIYETEPWQAENQPWFLNMVVRGKTNLSPRELLEKIFFIEKKLGRVRSSAFKKGAAFESGSFKTGPFEPRTIDIDILYYGNKAINTADLTIPHPFLAKRKFVLAPLCEIAPRKIHPILKKNSLQLLKECEDPSIVKKQ